MATAFAGIAGSAAWVLVSPHSAPFGLAQALQGLSPATALACLLIAARLFLRAPAPVRTLLTLTAAGAAVASHLPFASYPNSPLGNPAQIVSAGLVFAALSQLSRRRFADLQMRTALLLSAPLIGLTLIGLIGVAASMADAAGTSWLSSLSVGIATPLAFLGLAAWSLACATRWLPALRIDDRIALLTFVVLSLLVSITGLATFWAVHARLQNSEQERLFQSANRREMAFNFQLQTAERLASELAQRPSIARAMLAWHQRPMESEMVLREEIDAAWNESFTAIRFELAEPHPKPLPARGRMLESIMPPLRLDPNSDMRFELQWNKGLMVLFRVPVLQAGAKIGWIESQQRLAVLTAQLFESSDLGPNVEVKLCYPENASVAACLPNDLNSPVRQEALQQPNGQPTAIALGVRGEQGSMITADETDSHGVIDVYASVRRPLTLRLRQSVDSVMAPVREKLNQVILLMALLLGAGMAVLSLQIRPLASKLVTSELEAREAQAQARANEEHLRTVMDNVADGIITTDVQGNITYLNHTAEWMTGWQTDEAIGQPTSAVYTVVNAFTGKPTTDVVASVLSGGDGEGESDLDLLHRSSQSRIAVSERASLVRHSDGTIAGSVLVFHDATVQRARAAAMRHEASHDALTGLANRKALQRRLSLLSTEPAINQARVHSLLYIDLDHFKQVNDTAGHEAGDHLLQQVTSLMQKGLRGADMLARVGGDEFCALLFFCVPEHAARIAEGLRAAVAAFEFEWQGAIFKVGTSIGVVTFEAGFDDMAAILRNADTACYEAKRAGRGNVKIHDEVLYVGMKTSE